MEIPHFFWWSKWIVWTTTKSVEFPFYFYFLMMETLHAKNIFCISAMFYMIWLCGASHLYVSLLNSSCKRSWNAYGSRNFKLKKYGGYSKFVLFFIFAKLLTLLNKWNVYISNKKKKQTISFFANFFQPIRKKLQIWIWIWFWRKRLCIF